MNELTYELKNQNIETIVTEEFNLTTRLEERVIDRNNSYLFHTNEKFSPQIVAKNIFMPSLNNLSEVNVYRATEIFLEEFLKKKFSERYKGHFISFINKNDNKIEIGGTVRYLSNNRFSVPKHEDDVLVFEC